MIGFAARKNSVIIQHYLSILSLIERKALIKNINPLMTVIQKSKLLEKIWAVTTCTSHFQFNDHLKLYYKNVVHRLITIKRHDGIKYSQIKLKNMDNITELANLIEEQKVQKTEEMIVEVNRESSDSEDSADHEFLDSITIEKVPYKDNQYQHSFDINKGHYKHIVGSKGSMLKNLSAETETIIRVSKKKKHVVIIGSVQKRIIHAKRRINQLIDNSKNKLQFTHFISIPLNRNDIKQNYMLFKDHISEINNLEDTGFDQGMFQRPEKLHLTICMLHLLNDSDQEKAILALNNCKKDIIEPILNQNKQINIELRGLKCMETDPSKAKVLYINVEEETGLLQKMSNDINEYFIKEGLSRRQHDNVTLHMTVINTFYLKNKKQKKYKKHFNAIEILKHSKNIYLGKVNLSTFHISKLTAKSADGYFEATAKIQL